MINSRCALKFEAMKRIGFLGLCCLLLFSSVSATAQRKYLRGIIKDMQSDEPIPFASVIHQQSGRGSLTDSSGKFELNFGDWPTDSIEVTSVGYNSVTIPFPTYKDDIFITILLEVATVKESPVVKTKYNRALWFWRKIVKVKAKHEKTQYTNYSYEVYNKLELDLNNINKEKLGNVKLLKPFSFVLGNVDSSEEKPFLPVFLTETLSDYYYQRSPRKTRELIKASKTNGVDNESVTKLLGSTYQNVNVYNNFIPVFDKQFVSPFHDNADNYYNFKLLDTQYLSGKRLVHLKFTPKRKGENTFNGDCWIHDTSFAIQKITLRPSEEANLNFVEKLTLIQEFRFINDSTWFLSKDKFVADISPIGKNKSGFKGRKTSTYRNILYNCDSISTEIKKNKKAEEVIVLTDSEIKPDSFWSASRHEALSKNEKAVYKMIDTIQSLPKFKQYTETINFIGTGYKNLGNYQIGPWFNWITGNFIEGTRIRFDLGTNRKFNRKIYFHTYLAYGFGDKTFKGKAEAFFLPKKNPRFYLYGSYSNDLDNGQTYYDEITTDNIFALAVRKPGIPLKFQKVEEKRIEVFKETNFGLSFLLTAINREVTPLRNLPDKSFYLNSRGDALKTFETSLRFRYAHLEKFLENNFFRTSLGSDLPIAEFKVAKGWAGVWRSSYDYLKLSGSVSDYIKIPPYGSLYVNVFGGRVYGTLPYTLLEIHPGNEMYYYNKYAFNLMNRFEFISDRYTGFNVEHNIGNGLFRFIPLTRKLKFRQFWSAKGVWGKLSDANRNLNFVGNHSFQTLNDKTYIELGTGVDNILKVLRVDFIWRVAPTPLPKEQVKRFGIFFSFRLAF
jgi:hypothetical protein